MLRLKQPHIRRGFYTHKDPDTGTKFSSRSLSAVVADALNHRKQRHLPIPLNLAGIIEHNYCIENPDLCEDENTPKKAPKADVEPPAAPQLPPPAPSADPPKPITSYPPASKQLLDLVGTTRQWMAAGFRLRDRDAAMKKLEACINCEYWSGARDIWNFRCKKCGCCMRIKVRFQGSRCPLGRWT